MSENRSSPSASDPSNFPGCEQHLLTSWESVRQAIGARDARANIYDPHTVMQDPATGEADDPDGNMHYDRVDVVPEPVVFDTLAFWWVTCRCFIYVYVDALGKAGAVAAVNPEYVNRWAATRCAIDLDNVPLVKGRQIMNPSMWWCNASLGCDVPSRNLWTRHRDLHTILPWIERAAQMDPVIRNVQCMLNVRDKAQVPLDPARAPDAFAYAGGQGRLEPALQFPNKLPTLSHYTGPAYADIGFPTKLALELASRPPMRVVPWDQKRGLAVFRGSSTNQQRVLLVRRSQALPGLLDARLTGWNQRWYFDRERGIVNPPASPPRELSGLVGKRHRLTYEEQSAFKVVVIVCGWSAPDRWVACMQLNCAILYVKPTGQVECPDVWFTDLLKEGENYFTVRPDLSDLRQKLEWCRDNDDACRAMAERNLTFAAEHLREEGLLRRIRWCLERAAPAQGPGLHASMRPPVRLPMHVVPPSSSPRR